MRTGIVVEVTTAERDRLEAVIADRNSPQKHVWRAGIVLATAEGLGTVAIMRRTSKSKTVVWRWQERFAQEGVDGLLRDKTRPSRVKPFGPEVAERIIALTLAEPPGETTQWTGRAMAKATGVSLSYVQRVWRSHGLQPHRIRTFKLSNDPQFAAKVRDIVGLYVDPPSHAVVLSVDEKSQIQALDRTQPGLPMKKGRAGTLTHDYKRHGTTTLFAALDVLEGKVIGRCMQRHRHQEFIRFLNAIEKSVPMKKSVHVILDNYAAHKHPKVIAWLSRHPRVTFHFTPTSASWLNAVEGFFAALTIRRLKRGAFLGVVDLQAADCRRLESGASVRGDGCRGNRRADITHGKVRVHASGDLALELLAVGKLSRIEVLERTSRVAVQRTAIDMGVEGQIRQSATEDLGIGQGSACIQFEGGDRRRFSALRRGRGWSGSW